MILKNEENIFPAIDSRMKFCLLTMAGAGHEVEEMDFVSQWQPR